MKTVVLHIGLPKTGSTVVQKTLSASKEFLKQNSIAIAQTGTAACFHDGGQHALAIYFMKHRLHEFDDPLRVLDLDNLWGRLRAEVDRSECDQIFISSEWFAFDVYQRKHIEEIAAALDGVRTRVVVCIRELGHLVKSIYAQRIRDGYDGTIEQYVELLGANLNLQDIIDRWAAVFSPENVLRIDFEAIAGPNIVRRFVAEAFKIEYSATELLAVAAPENERLDDLILRAMLAVNKSKLDQETKNILRNDILAELNAGRGGFTLLTDISAPTADRIRHLSTTKIHNPSSKSSI